MNVVFNLVLVMCQLSCCCFGLSCLHDAANDAPLSRLVEPICWEVWEV